MAASLSSTVACAELAVELWASEVTRCRADVDRAEAALGDALDHARKARRALARAEVQLENAHKLLRQAEGLI